MKRRFWYWITDALGLLTLLGVIAFVLLRWSSLPDRLPAHFAANGEISAWAGKSSLTLLLVLAPVMFAGMEVLSFFPQSWNVPRRTPRALQATADAMAVLRLVLALFLSYLAFCTATCRGIGAWVLPVTAVLLLGNLAYLLVNSFRG